MTYSSMTLVQLRDFARSQGLKGISALKKQELINLLEEREGGSTPARQEQAAPVSDQVSQSSSSDDSSARVAEGREREEKRRRVGGQKRSYNQRSNRNTGRQTGQNRYQNADRRARVQSGPESTSADSGSRAESGAETEIEARTYNRAEDRTEIRTSNRAEAGTETRTCDRAEAATEARTYSETEAEYRELKQSTEAMLIEEADHLSTGDPEDIIPSESEEAAPHNTTNQTKAEGILELTENGYGFIRSDNYLTGDHDIYVSHSQIRKFNLKTGDILRGSTKFNSPNDKFAALIYIDSVNGYKPYDAQKRQNFEDLTPIFPNERIKLEMEGGPVSMRMLDLLSPIGKGQRGMIVSQPKTGKTTLLKQIAKSIIANEPDMKVIVLLIDERPEEVTDIRESIEGKNAEVIYSTFDELPEHHRKVSEMVLERAKRLVEHKEDVVILLDSITRLARAYNLVVPTSGRTLSGGLDPAALYMPKKFFGAARNMREGGSLTILATALVDTGSKMDDVVFEEFKGTGNMEVVLDRRLAEKRIFPAINIQKSGTRREDLLLTKEEQEIGYALHREMSGPRSEENMEQILRIFRNSRTNREFIDTMKQSLLKKYNRS